LKHPSPWTLLFVVADIDDLIMFNRAPESDFFWGVSGLDFTSEATCRVCFETKDSHWHYCHRPRSPSEALLMVTRMYSASWAVRRRNCLGAWGRKVGVVAQCAGRLRACLAAFFQHFTCNHSSFSPPPASRAGVKLTAVAIQQSFHQSAPSFPRHMAAWDLKELVATTLLHGLNRGCFPPCSMRPKTCHRLEPLFIHSTSCLVTCRLPQWVSILHKLAANQCLQHRSSLAG
jgi:hypothetical protein